MALSHTVSEINEFNTDIQAGHKKMSGKPFPPKTAGKRFPQKRRESHFPQNSADGSMDTLWAKNLVEIALSRTVSEINMFLHLTLNFKMAAKTNFWKKSAK